MVFCMPIGASRLGHISFGSMCHSEARLGLLGLLGLLGCRSPGPAPTPRPRPEPEDSAEGGSSPLPTDQASREKLACLRALIDEPQPAPRFHPLLRALCSEWINAEIPGVALAVVEDGVLVLHAERGVTCLGQDAPIDASTSFRLGSISKTFTAALLMGQIQSEAGSPAGLSLAFDPAGLPGVVWPEGLEHTQLGALLRHRSGLTELDPQILVDDGGQWRRALRAGPSGPGEYSYVNANYVLAGAVLEHHMGTTYDLLLRTRIGPPLALGSLEADPARALEKGAACGHLHEGAKLEPIPVTEDLAFMPGDPSWLQPAGGVLASAEDLARFALALGTPMVPGSDPMLEPGEPVPDSNRDERYGLGLRSWMVSTKTGLPVRLFGHSGDNGIFHAELLFTPGERAVVVLGNAGAPMPATRAAAEHLLAESARP